MPRSLPDARRMGEVMETLRLVSTVTDLDRLLQLILKASRKTMDAEASSLMLLDHAKDELYFQHIRGGSRHIKAVRLKVGQGIAGRVAGSGRAMIVNDVSRCRFFYSDADRLTGFTTRRVLAVPLKVRNTIIGVLEAINKKGGRGFDAVDLALFKAFAGQAAVSIENARLYNLAAYDGLTRVFTRRYFDGWFESEMSRTKRYGRPLSVLMIDIDHFKRVNDGFGHAGGDAALSETAAALKEAARETDVLARYGGEEFIAVLPETDAAGAVRQAEAFRACVEKNAFEFEGRPLKVTVSIGAATWGGRPEMTGPRLADEADKALYAAKQTRNSVSLFEATASTK